MLVSCPPPTLPYLRASLMDASVRQMKASLNHAEPPVMPLRMIASVSVKTQAYTSQTMLPLEPVHPDDALD